MVEKRPFAVTEKIDETPEVLLIRFKAQDSKPLSFDPGMFVMTFGIDTATNKEFTGRAFSIASEPEIDTFELFVVKAHDGHTSYFVNSKIGELFNVTGPHGQFKFDAMSDKKILCLAGGTGFAPFMSMLRHIKKTAAGTDTSMIYSIKYPTEIIRKQELKDFEGQIKLNTLITVTRPAEGDGWTGKTGHIDAEMIKAFAPDYMERSPYICGPLAFVKAIKDALISLGVPQEKIKADVWG
ncbi:MAG TPA: FAD-binding oxidoreductase [Candidatus Acidoferrales bacterium]|nr:FAD-binding oxidoreductase [Candidatus Acidoferrales bacterium]